MEIASVKRFSREHTVWIVTAVAMIAYYLLQQYSIFYYDDLYYYFIYDPDQIRKVPVRTLGDIWNSQVLHYMHHNGRFIVHFLNQYFVAIGGLKLFNVVSTFVFSLLVYVMYQLSVMIAEPRKFITAGFMPVLFLLLAFSIRPGEVVLSGPNLVINYMWSGAFSITAIYFYLKFRDRKEIKVYTKILLFVAMVVAGGMNEAFSIGISVALFIQMMIDVRHKRKVCLWILSGFWAGTAIVVFAPGNFIKLGDYNDSTELSLWYYNFLRIGYHLVVFFVALCLCLIAVLRRKTKRKAIELIKQQQLLYTPIIVAMFFMLGVAFTAERQLTLIEFLSIIIALQYIQLLFPRGKKGKIIVVAVSCISLLWYADIYALRRNVGTYILNLTDQCRNTQDGWVQENPSAVNNEYRKHPCSVHFAAYDYRKFALSLWVTDGISDNFLKFYPVECQGGMVFNDKYRIDAPLDAWHYNDSDYLIFKDSVYNGKKITDWAVVSDSKPENLRDWIYDRFLSKPIVCIFPMYTPDGLVYAADVIPGINYDRIKLVEAPEETERGKR